MARRAFFSFHYERDIWRSCIVRNSWVTKPDREDAGFWDESLWEAAKKKGDDAVQRMIDEGLKGTSVTVVLIGTETWSRKWVKYEIEKSHERENGLLGVYIHNIEGTDGRTDMKGNNPFSYVFVERNGRMIPLADLYPTYDYVLNDGYGNLGAWIEAAAKAAGK
jgi:hypothetical protein